MTALDRFGVVDHSVDEPFVGLRSESLADVVERLCVLFQPRLTPHTVVTTVRRCRRELDIVSGPALPELVERLAKQRLQDQLDARTATDPAGRASRRRRPPGSRRSVRPHGLERGPTAPV